MSEKAVEYKTAASLGLLDALMPSLNSLEEKIKQVQQEEEDEIDPYKISDSDCELDFHPDKKRQAEKEKNKDLEGKSDEEKLKIHLNETK